MAKQSWLHYKHPHVEDRGPVWALIMAHYTASVSALRTSEYLIQRFQGESSRQFDERLRTADYIPLLSVLIDEYLGKFGQNEPKTNRQWKDDDREGLGTPDDEGTPAYRLWSNADGRGGNWLTMMEDAALLLLCVGEVWGIAEGVRRDSAGNVVAGSRVRAIEPWAVMDWIEDDFGNPIEVKVMHQADGRGSVMDEPQKVTRYTVYRPEGYEVWEETKEGEAVSISGPQRYGGEDGQPFVYWSDASRTTPILPIWRTRLSLRRLPAEVLAAKNGVIYNQQSERDNLLRVANTPVRVLATNESLEDIEKRLKAGFNTLILDPSASQAHYYMAPDISSATIATEVVAKKLEEFFVSGFRSYENSIRGKQKTATEIEQESAGERGFLSLLATAVDEFEMAAGRRLEQIEFPETPANWGQFYVERSKDFKPIDEQAEAERLVMRYFSGPVPIGSTGRIDAAKRIAEADGLTVDEAEIEAEAAGQATDNAQALAMEQEINALLNANVPANTATGA